MYVASSRPAPRADGAPGGVRGLPGTVFALGAVSLLTDVSAEMVTAFLPVYLLFTLQLTYVQFGLLDGIYTGATALLRLVGGYVADRYRRPKAVALAGYGLSAVTKLALPAVGASALGIGAVLSADRAGKGLRTAPRDALISLATPADRLGTAFGVHRTMDTIGAMLGPLVTFLILAYLGTAGGPVFMISFLFALLGVIVLVFFVRDGTPELVAGLARRAPVSVRAGLRLLRDRPVRRTAVAAAVLGLATLSDAFLFVVLQKASGVGAHLLPLLPLGTAVVFLLAATPMGRLADRAGRWRVFVGGHVVLLGAYLLMTGPLDGLPLVVAALLLHGLFYAATDGVLSAHGGTLVPVELRASGLAIMQTGQALARLASSVVFGVLLQYLAFATALWIAVSALATALLVVTVWIRPLEAAR
ncbi:MAG TPA: MFS transporter [Pseudonocardiaceae bacterium]